MPPSDVYVGLPWWLSDKESACSAGATGDLGLILGLEDPLEESMATHSSILAWRIPWTEGPGRSVVHRVAKSQTWLKRLSIYNDAYIPISWTSECVILHGKKNSSHMMLLRISPWRVILDYKDGSSIITRGQIKGRQRCQRWLIQWQTHRLEECTLNMEAWAMNQVMQEPSRSQKRIINGFLEASDSTLPSRHLDFNLLILIVDFYPPEW